MRIACLLWVLAACTDSGESLSGCDDEAIADHPLCTEWVMGEGATSAVVGGASVLVDITDVSLAQDEDGAWWATVTTSGVPSYETTVTQDTVDSLEARPNYDDDFLGDGPTIAVGDVVQFGDDIGYDSTGCSGDDGYGYWPPGPTCPDDAEVTAVFPLEVTESAETCYTGLNHLGIAVNGVALFNWFDGQSYESEDVWHNIAPILEQYDVGICGGHAAGVTYHHHSPSDCLQELVGDDGSGHSPIYGFAADGVPIYGYYHDDGELAEPCWKARDYDDPESETGCGEAGVRSCQLVDPLDVSQGFETVGVGPATSEVVTSMSGNDFDAESGLYFEDYWFDEECADQGGKYLDIHNGHDHDDYGYHYHFTMTYPYVMGPVFYGELGDDALASCQSNPAESPGGGGPP